MDKYDILRGMGFFRSAPVDVQATISDNARHLALAPGDVLFREGEVQNSVAAVGAGSVRVFRMGATGREITLYHVRPHQASLVGMLAVLLGTPVIATGQAEIASEVVVVSASVLRDLARTSDAVRTFVFETMARALVDVTGVLEDVAFRPMESRLAAMLLDHFAAAEAILMRHEDIASELGTAREVVSRLLETYEQRGAIELSRGRIGLRDAAVLRQLV